MLTDNQNKLIEDIKREFSKMNTSTKVVGGGLISKADIDNRLSASIKRRAELQCITDATHKAVLELMHIDIERLNYDLIPMGMIAQRSFGNKFYVRIDDLDKQDQTSTDMIPFNYNMTSLYENLPDGSGYRYYTGFHSVEYACAKYDSIDQMCKDRWFAKRVEERYKLFITNQKCK